MSVFDIVHLGEREVLARTENVMVTVSLAPPSVEMLAAMIDEAKLSRGRPLASYVLIAEGHRPPDDEARHAILGMVRGVGRTCRGMACFVEGEGFVAAAKRSVMTLVSMSAGADFPIRVFGRRTEATTWLLQRLADAAPPRLTAVSLAAAADELRAELEAGQLRRAPRSREGSVAGRAREPVRTRRWG